VGKYVEGLGGLPPPKLRHDRDQDEERDLLAAVRHVRSAREVDVVSSLVEQALSLWVKFVVLDAGFHSVEVLRHVLVNYVLAVPVGDVKVYSGTGSTRPRARGIRRRSR